MISEKLQLEHMRIKFEIILPKNETQRKKKKINNDMRKMGVFKLFYRTTNFFGKRDEGSEKKGEGRGKATDSLN